MYQVRRKIVVEDTAIHFSLTASLIYILEYLDGFVLCVCCYSSAGYKQGYLKCRVTDVVSGGERPNGQAVIRWWRQLDPRPVFKQHGPWGPAEAVHLKRVSTLLQ